MVATWKEHLTHLSYMVRHKFWVLVAGLRLRVPIWRLLVHDMSRFGRAEWKANVLNYSGRRPTDGSFEQAKVRHSRANPHHWEYWDGEEMPEEFVREMVADWLGRGRAEHGYWDAPEWYAREKHTVRLHPASRDLAERLLENGSRR